MTTAALPPSSAPSPAAAAAAVGRRGGTVVAIPPRRPAAGATAGASAVAGVGGGGGVIVGSAMPADAGALLDTIDTFGRVGGGGGVGGVADGGVARGLAVADSYSSAGARRSSVRPPPASVPVPSGSGTAALSASASASASAFASGASCSSPPSSFDPIEFLNHHFLTESSLASALPDLRHTVSERISRLDESISDSIRRQSDLADSTASDVARAKAAIAALHGRVMLVQSKARLSERAVLEITRDMKRLDYAKRHLSRTITALKRLHMLLHAVQQLRVASAGDAAQGRPHPDYRSAANLVDATRLLLGHFDGYMGSVQRMRDVRDAVGKMRLELRDGVVHGFRVVGLGFKAAEEKADAEKGAAMKKGGSGSNANSDLVLAGDRAAGSGGHGHPEGQAAASAASAAVASGSGLSPSLGPQRAAVPIAPPMPPAVLSDACLVVDALGAPTRREFLDLFCGDHLEAYSGLFDPRKSGDRGGARNNLTAGEPKEALAVAPKPSFKIPSSGSSHGHGAAGAGALMMNEEDDARPAASVNSDPASLDQVDRRYAWYRRQLRSLFDEKFRSVFPPAWNVHHEMTRRFLSITGDHLLLLLAPGRSCRDRDCENVTVLLKALQKTILFEKEMTARLQRDYGVVFVREGAAAAAKDNKDGGGRDEDTDRQRAAVLGENGEPLEFDEEGRAVAAGSAEGIRIKYERKMKERERGGTNVATNVGAGDQEAQATDAEAERRRPVPASSLVGVASSSFDRYMGPYIALEEQNMDEQLVESTADAAVDARGELPVFTSSTALFVYIKNSITRCTALTRGRTFYLLHRAFQDTLRKYATVLGGKFPPPVSAVGNAALGHININLTAASFSSAGMGAAGGANAAAATAAYRIPEGEEVTVCHVIDTCEYCADTVEALEDLIRDKIDDEYKDKIDMSGEQDTFHDVTARGLRVLVSGLELRTEAAFREMTATNWGNLDTVGEESSYVRTVHATVQPFVVTVRSLIPNSYFRSFCDKFAAAFASAFHGALLRLKRISEAGTQQLLLDVYNLKTLVLKLPVMEKEKKASSTPSRNHPSSPAAGSTIPPAMYTKMVTRQFAKIETLLKLVGTPRELLIDVFKAQWEGGSALDLQTVMNLKGMKRAEQTSTLEKFGVDPALASQATMTDHVQTLQDKTSDVAAKVNSDLSQMRQKVDDFRKAFR